jgi:hypothetical protein
MDAVRGNSLVWLLLTILPITGFDVRAGEKPIPYISPGFRVGYEFGKDLTVGLKISLGVNEEGNYYNITLGVRAVSRRDLTRSAQKNGTIREYWWIRAIKKRSD